jgi:hypothetical protein
MAKLPSDNQPDRRLAPSDDDNDNERELPQDADPGSPNVTKTSQIKNNVTTSSRIKNN